MNFFNILNLTSIILSLFIVGIPSSTVGHRLRRNGISSGQNKPIEYKRLASHCFIQDYQSWLERQKELIMWLDLAKILHLPIEKEKEFQQELKKFRLQYECLRVMERLPVSIGPG